MKRASEVLNTDPFRTILTPEEEAAIDALPIVPFERWSDAAIDRLLADMELEGDL